MLALRTSKHSSDKCIPNILPCRIHHNGPVKVTKRYWAPTAAEGGTKTSHFRGRKLRGRTVRIPDTYQGVVAKSIEHISETNTKPSGSRAKPVEVMSDEEDAEDEQDTEPAGFLETNSTFDEFVVWGHDQLPDADDVFVKGVEEWIAFAEAIHGRSGDQTSKKDT